ncbi:MAG: sigma-54 dependent transcriptional regulator [Proteobacteria bacterium]|nr:sigma-54 dependent transcriptional regulator [Pseudomonadota bacterium]MBU1612178.1 sigma-54 dependent transcriptional regulator [Pseudomonadota bacterium]
MATILIIDDEESIRFSLKGILEDEGHEVMEAETGEDGLEALKSRVPQLLFLDIWLPGLDGLEVLERTRQSHPDLPVVMISGHGNIETAVTALKAGAFDFIEKPLSLEKVITSTRNALEMTRLAEENRVLKSRIMSTHPFQLTGESEPVIALREAIRQVAPTDAWVLITGENGTGKEIVARSLHLESRRADKPLVAVNCAAIPEELIEAELFGHEKGAFTGAETSKIGKFELAHMGTLLLDEIADMSLKTQAKILRILQEQRFEHVGGSKTIQVDVRVIAATNKDLLKEIEAGNFREDLYYRLKVFPLEVPPLRERTGDLALLIEDFVGLLCREHGFKPLTFSPDALAALACYPWPGNVRELKNFVERMQILFSGKTVYASQLPREFRGSVPIQPQSESRPCPENHQPCPAIPDGPIELKQARAEFETRFLVTKLKEFDNNVSQLAKAVGLERSSLYRKLKLYGIQTD